MTFRELFIEAMTEEGLSLDEIQRRMKFASTLVAAPDWFNQELAWAPGISDEEGRRGFKETLKNAWQLSRDPQVNAAMRDEAMRHTQQIYQSN